MSTMQIVNVCEKNASNMEIYMDNLIDTSNNNDKGKDSNKQGAIPTNSNNEISQPQNYLDRQGDKPAPIKHLQNNIRNSSSLAKMPMGTENKLIEQITAGYKILIIMRGAPGSGKTYLANSLLKKSNILSGGFSLKDFVLSSDDYFYDSSGQYRYNVEKLGEAHAVNKRRVREKTAAGWSPIIIDNTNMRLWDMFPYAQIAVRHGYILQLLEPNTPWRMNVDTLAMKNNHRVHREKLQIMLNKYEKATASHLVKMVKDTKYNVPLPQMRNFPPLSINPKKLDKNETINDFSKEKELAPENTIISTETPMIFPTAWFEPKPQRKNMRSKSLSKIALKQDKNEDENVNKESPGEDILAIDILPKKNELSMCADAPTGTK